MNRPDMAADASGLGKDGSVMSGLDLWLVAALCLILFVFAHWAGLTNPYVGNDDIRQQIFWMEKWADPALYPDDIFSEYAQAYVPYGVKALYLLPVSLGMNAVYCSKLLTGGLFVLLGLCMFGIGHRLGGRGLAWAVLCVFWLMPSFLYNMSGGISRSFASPLLALFALSWISGSARWMGLTLVLQALCIPYICILSTASCVLAGMAGKMRPALSPPFPRTIAHVLLVAALAATILVMSHSFDAAGFGPLTGKADMAGRPEFTEPGRLEIYPQPGIFFDAVYYPFERIGLFLEVGLATGIATLTLILGLAFLFARKADWRGLLAKSHALVFLAVTAFALYAVARLVLLKLFVPDRYISYFLSMFYCLLLAICYHAGLRRFLSTPRRAAAAILCLAVLGGIRLKNEGLFDYSANAALFEAAQHTPKNALFAGHPKLMDDVLTFGQRKVFVSYKLAHPWSKGWWNFVRPRIEQFFQAYYAADPQDVRDFCRENHVDFLVVDPAQFQPDFIAKRPFFAPFDIFIRELTKGRTTFALLSAEDFPFTPLEGGLRLIDMRQSPGHGD